MRIAAQVKTLPRRPRRKAAAPAGRAALVNPAFRLFSGIINLAAESGVVKA
ncbi:MAG: hypothetical protein U1F37_18175 [Alphaproteobacteria bacterium]